MLGAPILTCSASTSSKMHSEYPLYGPESIMARKAHGTCLKGVQLVGSFFDAVWRKKNHFRICDGAAIRRLGTELPATIAISRKISAIGLILTSTITPSNRLVFHFENWNSMIEIKSEPITFYDSVTGKPLFKAPVGRTMSGFLKESQDHGWPSFRDEEVVWENVRCLENGEAVSLDGSHLGHNLPDNRGNRYCINLVSVAGKPSE